MILPGVKGSIEKYSRHRHYKVKKGTDRNGQRLFSVYGSITRRIYGSIFEKDKLLEYTLFLLITYYLANICNFQTIGANECVSEERMILGYN